MSLAWFIAGAGGQSWSPEVAQTSRRLSHGNISVFARQAALVTRATAEPQPVRNSAIQARADLSKMLRGMLQLQTLDLGMSNEVADLHRSIILPAPPFDCRVGEPCSFALST